MNLQIIGCSHHQSNVSIRERLAFTEAQIKPFLEKFYRQFPNSEAVLLSTCNRTEFFAAGQSNESVPSQREMVNFLASERGISGSDIESGLYQLNDREAVRHLFSVAASLDSMVIGETQILAQVKRAYELAIESNQAIPLTHRVFQSAIQVARRVTNETNLHSNRVSVPSVAVNVLAKQIFERLDNKRILVVGAGDMASETLTYLKGEGGSDIVVVNRTPENAKTMANQFNGRTEVWDRLADEVAVADLIISTTGATEPVIDVALFESIKSLRKQKPLFILDLAVPRDVQPEVGERQNVYLYTLDDLQKVCDRNLKSRKSQFPKAVKILDQETDRFLSEMRGRASNSTIVALRDQANQTKEAELTWLMNRIGDDISDDQRATIEQAFHRLVNKMLHSPLKSVRDDSEQGSNSLLEAVRRLFQLGD
ncbi:glutamyl-tRNA reductase [Mariniblastus sp.]|nr:glutamyl-tRNA reductase [Mariniblastus sp.]